MSAKEDKELYFKGDGFTLLELILVMVVISTVLAMAAPSLRGFFSSRKIHDAADNILSLIRYARSQAITEGSNYRLNFDNDNGCYWLTIRQGGVDSDLNNEFGRRFLLPDDTTVELEKEDDQTGNEKYIAFFPQGLAEVGTITLTDRRGDVISIMTPSPAETYRIVVPEETETSGQQSNS
jgi:prepilin-type N-terminal cleavage/methylation domain-containing protein